MSNCTLALGIASTLGAGIGERAGIGGGVGVGVGREATHEHERGDVGLSKGSYSSVEDYKVTVWEGGSLVESLPCGRSKRWDRLRPGGVVDRTREESKRGRVVGFSKASRRRFRKKMAKVDNKHLGSALFVTLTYPAEFPSARESKKHLERFIKRLRRKYEGCGVVWRLEFQQRGAPHYHLIVLGVEFIPHQWAAAAWYEVVGSGDLRHLAAGTQVQKVMNERMAKSYLEKYMAKIEQDTGQEECGRVWGMRWTEAYMARRVVRSLTRSQFFRFARSLDGLRRAYARLKGRFFKRKVSHDRFSASWFCNASFVSIRFADLTSI